jgi:GxxExxY protein
MYNGGDQTKFLYTELSYKIRGCLFDVHNALGGGHKEKYYQKAVAEALRSKNISFVEQYYVPVKFQNIIVGKYYLDFLVENKIVLELKRGRYTSVGVINQTKQYLNALDLKLAIIACFATDAVITKRILNLY